jgi:hypothetical protein
VGFLGKRRAVVWVAGLERWAKKEVKDHTEQTVRGKNKIDRHGMYCLGVMSAVTIAKSGPAPRLAMPKDRDQRRGFADASTLIRNVLTAGSTPGHDYLELLNHPELALQNQ